MIDYEHTFAPVAKMTIVQALLVVITFQDWHVMQMDVTNAFLHRELYETVYIKLPLGYSQFVSRIVLNQGENFALTINLV